MIKPHSLYVRVIKRTSEDAPKFMKITTDFEIEILFIQVIKSKPCSIKYIYKYSSVYI